MAARGRIRLFEVSIKTPVAQAAAATAGFMAFLAEVGAERDDGQQAKTRWALEHAARQHRESEDVTSLNECRQCTAIRSPGLTRSGQPAAESVDQEAVTQTAVADRQG